MLIDLAAAEVMRALLGWNLARGAFFALALPFAGASAALAQSPAIDEVRIGALAHSLDAANAESGVDLNLEVLFRRSTYNYNSSFLNTALNPRIHLGTSINTSGDTSQLYAGLTWDAKLTRKLSLELSFGGALHDGPTGDLREGEGDSYGCSVNFRESVSLGYAVDDRWTVYGTVAHMSNAGLCDHNTGLTSVGLRLGYKLQ